MEASLTDRINSYQDLSDLQLMRKLPVCILLNGRSFRKLTALIDKPYAPDFTELMVAAMIKLYQEVEGVIFSYCYDDQIFLALRNDQHINTEAWYQNKVQSIVSASSSLATLEFNRVRVEKDIKLIGDAIFTAKTFLVPNITELANTIIHMQQNCFHRALSDACFYELLKKNTAIETKQILSGKTMKQKSEILFDKCRVEFNNYPLQFKRGIAAYRRPSANHKTGQIKNKIHIDDELPLFSQEKEWLFNILKGQDIIKLEEQ